MQAGDAEHGMVDAVAFERQSRRIFPPRSCSGRLHGRPHRGPFALSPRITVTNVPKQSGLSPVNLAVQDGSDAVITPATATTMLWHEMDHVSLSTSEARA